MTTTAPASTVPTDVRLQEQFARAGAIEPAGPLSTSLTFAWRAVLKMKHLPEQLFDATLFPVMITLVFTYLFGGAVAGSTGEYLQYALPGILVLGVALISMYSGVALSTDISRSIYDRFLTLPMWPRSWSPSSRR